MGLLVFLNSDTNSTRKKRKKNCIMNPYRKATTSACGGFSCTSTAPECGVVGGAYKHDSCRGHLSIHVALNRARRESKPT